MAGAQASGWSVTQTDWKEKGLLNFSPSHILPPLQGWSLRGDGCM